MKVVFKKIFFLILVLLRVVFVYAKQTPPAPVNSGQMNALSGGPPPPPGGAIDGEIVLLFVAALLFGFYTIYASRLKKKRSI